MRDALESQVSRLGGEVVYLWKPSADIEPTLLYSTSIVGTEVSSRILVAQRRLQNRNLRLTADWRENPSTVMLGWYEPELGVHELMAEISLIEQYGLSLEDVRLFDCSESGVALVGAVWPIGGPLEGPDRAVTDQAIVRLDSEFNIASLDVLPIGFNGDPRHYEKNWTPWLGESRVTYSLSETHVTYDLGSLRATHGSGIRWEFGEPHGGTQWLSVGDTSVCIFHSSFVREPSTGLSTYVLGAARASNAAPYDILEITPEPLLIASTLNPRVVGSSEVLFASGIARKNGSLLVGIGVNDVASAIVSIPENSLFSLMSEKRL